MWGGGVKIILTPPGGIIFFKPLRGQRGGGAQKMLTPVKNFKKRCLQQTPTLSKLNVIHFLHYIYMYYVQ